jgi:purine-binding chemotaxis protein CheW
VLQLPELTAVPDSPPYVAGAMNLRGEVLPVVDLARLVGVTRPDYTLDTPIIVSRSEGHVLGLIVDAVQDVLELGENAVDEPAEALGMRRLLAGVARTDQGLLMVFDLSRIMELASVTGAGREGGVP